MPNVNLSLSKKLFSPTLFPILYDYSHRFEFYKGSAGSGKSYFITQKLIIRACSEKIKILVCRRYGTTIRNTCFALFKEILNSWKLTPYIKIRESDFNIQFPNGSEIIFTGLDEETKLLSLNNIGTIFIEEIYEVPKTILEQLNLRLRGNIKNQQIIAAFNPISKNHWLYDYCVVNPPQSFLFSETTYKDNPFLSNEYIKALEEMVKRNPAKAKVYVFGEWGVNTDAVIFHNWRVDDFNHADLKGELCCGLDFGFINDATALICAIADDEARTLHIFKEWYAKGKTNSEIADTIQYLGLSKSVIIADSAEEKSIEEIKRAGVLKIKPAKKGKGSILQGIDKLLDYDIIVHPSCVNTIIELENYSWKQDKASGAYLNEPQDEYNHCIDALRYSLQCIGKKLKTLDKNIL